MAEKIAKINEKIEPIYCNYWEPDKNISQLRLQSIGKLKPRL